MKLSALVAIAVLASAAIPGTRAADADVPHLTVIGTAKIEVQPDLLNWTVTVDSKGGSADQLVATEDASVATTLATIRAAGIEAKDIQTSVAQLFENREFRSGSFVSNGYKAQALISFRCRQVGLYRKLWLSLAKLPGVSVQSSGWDTSNRIATQDKAREQALRSARAKAEDMAAVAGVSLLEPITIEEIPTNPNQMVVHSFSAGVGATAIDEDSVAPGTIAITARVQVTFRIGTK